MAKARKKPSEKAAEKSTFIVRTDAVIVAGTPHFYAEQVKLSDADAKPYLRDGRIEKT